MPQKAHKTEETPRIPNTPIRFLLYVSRPHKWWVVIAMLSAFSGQFLMSISPYFIQKIVDAFTSTIPYSEQLSTFEFWGVIYVLALGFAFASWRVSGFSGLEWLTRANATGYSVLYRYISKHSHTYFTNRFAGALSNKVSNASDGVEHLLERSLWGWYPELVSLVVGSALLFSVDLYIAVAFLIVFTGMFGANVFLVKKRHSHVVAYAAASSQLRGDGVDYLSNITAARQYARTEFELRRIGLSIKSRRIKDVVQWKMSEWGIVMNNAVAFFIVGAVLFYVFFLLKQDLITPGGVILVLTVLNRMTHIIIFLGNAMNGFVRVYGEIQEGLDAILEPHEITDKKGAKDLVIQEGKIEWSNVSFEFGENQVFKNFDLTINPGERVGLVGPSGAGKTTFVSLLLRQHEITGGSIAIDWQDIKEVTQDSLRHNIAVVPQEPLLFHRSIRENIAYGNPDATDEEVVEVAKKAQAHDFIEALPDGYDTLVGERGVKLSGGQRQRVAIARAMLKNAPILVLDEATSALDSESEVAIQKALHELMEGKTVVAIAHRLSTLREMDRILVLEGGKIVEDGTHNELVKKKGVYASLWEHQAGGFLQE